MRLLNKPLRRVAVLATIPLCAIFSNVGEDSEVSPEVRAGSVAAVQALPQDTSHIMPQILKRIPNAASHCYVPNAGAKNWDTPAVRHARSLFEAAANTPIGQRIHQGLGKSNIPICYFPNQGMTPHLDDSIKAIKFGKRYDSPLFNEAASVEEQCHAVVTSAATRNKVFFGVNNYYDPKTFIKLAFFNEAVCSSASITHALYLKERKNDSALWDTFTKHFGGYDPVIQAIQKVVQQNSDFLTNGVAQFVGIQAWLRSKYLREHYARNMLEGYNSMLEDDVIFRNSRFLTGDVPTHKDVSWIGALGVLPGGYNALSDSGLKPGVSIRFEDDAKLFDDLPSDVLDGIRAATERAVSLEEKQGPHIPDRYAQLTQ